MLCNLHVRVRFFGRALFEQPHLSRLPSRHRDWQGVVWLVRGGDRKVELERSLIFINLDNTVHPTKNLQPCALEREVLTRGAKHAGTVSKEAQPVQQDTASVALRLLYVRQTYSSVWEWSGANTRHSASAGHPYSSLLLTALLHSQRHRWSL